MGHDGRSSNFGRRQIGQGKQRDHKQNAAGADGCNANAGNDRDDDEERNAGCGKRRKCSWHCRKGEQQHASLQTPDEGAGSASKPALEFVDEERSRLSRIGLERKFIPQRGYPKPRCRWQRDEWEIIDWGRRIRSCRTSFARRVLRQQRDGVDLLRSTRFTNNLSYAGVTPRPMPSMTFQAPMNEPQSMYLTPPVAGSDMNTPSLL